MGKKEGEVGSGNRPASALNLGNRSQRCQQPARADMSAVLTLLRAHRSRNTLGRLSGFVCAGGLALHFLKNTSLPVAGSWTSFNLPSSPTREGWGPTPFHSQETGGQDWAQVCVPTGMGYSCGDVGSRESGSLRCPPPGPMPQALELPSRLPQLHSAGLCVEGTR